MKIKKIKTFQNNLLRFEKYNKSGEEGLTR